MGFVSENDVNITASGFMVEVAIWVPNVFSWFKKGRTW